MKAKIVEVMESWPLQLRLKTSTGELNFSLSENANVKCRGIPVDPGELRPGQGVQFFSQETNGILSELEISDLSDPLHNPVSSEDREAVNECEEVNESEATTTVDPVTIEKVAASSNGWLNEAEFLCLSNITKISIDELQDLPEWQPEIVLYSVCENDDRKQVMNTTTVPWRWICKLIISFPVGGKLAGTGWFIGSKAVMTAGHNVYSRERGGWANEIMVIPGMMGESLPFGSMIGTSYRCATGWISNQDTNYDYGCIILPSPDLGNQVGYFGFAMLSDESLNDLLVTTSGYPKNKPAGTQWFGNGKITETTAQEIKYMIDTYGGQSGGPTWCVLNNQYTAIGIHAHGGCPNNSVRINSDVYTNMMTWRDSNQFVKTRE